MTRWSFHGYAIVSDDDRIADADGRFPDALRNEADWAYFQAGLDAAALTLIGRRSHEAAPNAKARLRLVMSRTGEPIRRRDDGAWWWDPARTPLGEALAAVAPAGGIVAVPGGRDAFDLVGPAGFRAFHLARAHGVRLPGGRGLFAACEARGAAEAGEAADALLAAGGLRPEPRRWLDEAADVSLVVWRRGS